MPIYNQYAASRRQQQNSAQLTQLINYWKMLSHVRPHNTMINTSFGGQQNGMRLNLRVLPDEEMGETPIYNFGGGLQSIQNPVGLKFRNSFRR